MIINRSDYDILVQTIESYHEMCRGKDKEMYFKALDVISRTNQKLNEDRKYKAKFIADKRKANPSYGQSTAQREAHARTVAKVKKELGIED